LTGRAFSIEGLNKLHPVKYVKIQIQAIEPLAMEEGGYEWDDSDTEAKVAAILSSDKLNTDALKLIFSSEDGQIEESLTPAICPIVEGEDYFLHFPSAEKKLSSYVIRPSGYDPAKYGNLYAFGIYKVEGQQDILLGETALGSPILDSSRHVVAHVSAYSQEEDLVLATPVTHYADLLTEHGLGLDAAKTYPECSINNTVKSNKTSL